MSTRADRMISRSGRMITPGARLIGPSPVRVLASHAVVAVLVAVCGLAFAPAFGGQLTAAQFAPSQVVIAVLVAAFVPAAVVAACVLTRATAALTAGAALLTSAVAVVAATRCGTGVLHGPRQLLTAALPAAASPAACGAVAVIVAFASLAAALLVGYARLPALAVLPGLVCLIAALALDASIAFPPSWFAALVVVLVGVTLITSRGAGPDSSDLRGVSRRGAGLHGAGLRGSEPSHREPGGSGAMRAGFSVGATVIVLAAAAAIGLASSHSAPSIRETPAAAQDLIAPPLQPRAAIQPMTQYPAFANGADPVSLTGTASRAVTNLPMVTLGTFTGQTWTTATHFRRAAEKLSSAPATQPVTVSITAVNAQALSWLVRPDRPSSVDRSGLGVDPRSGDLVVPSGAEYPSQYRIIGSAPTDATAAESADPPVAWHGPVATDADPVPASLLALADAARPAANGYLQLITLLTRLHDGSYRATTAKSAPSGCGYVQVEALLDPTGNHIGTSEQYASAFAIAARLLGYNARVVLGFTPHYAADKHSFTITGADVHAWDQVQFTHAGWVTFDPTPTRDANSPVPVQAQAPPVSLPTPSTAPTTPAPARPTPAPPKASAQRGAHPPTVAILLAAVAAGVVASVSALPTLKVVRRRRRRRAAGPALAVYGAWQELTDRLRDFGVSAGRGRSTAQVIAAAPAEVRGDMRVVGTLVDHAGYAPESAGNLDVLTAWAHTDRAITTLRTRVARWRRIVATIDPRSLR